MVAAAVEPDSWNLARTLTVEVDVRMTTRRSMPSGAADLRLVEPVLGGDPSAFRELVKRHDDRLRSLAFKLLGGDRG